MFPGRPGARMPRPRGTVLESFRIMEYLVLARKWRPQVFEDVVGQDHAVRTLKNSIRFGRIGHAYLFSGPRGIGKTSVARILAKAVNCVRGPSEIPCNECVNCREIRDGVSMDVREIDGASNRGIDEIRELRENIKFAPVSSRYKVYIIDEVHMLTKEAFNALLKTLEEPPAHVLFVFATTENHKIPATILSRCQHFDFRRVSIQQMAGQLRKIAASEEISVSDRALVWISRAGEGSMRDALSIFDQVISYSGSAISDEDVEAILHLQDRRFLMRLMGAVLDRKAGEALKAVQEAYYSGVDMRHFYQLLLEAFMHLLRVKVTGGGESLDLPEDEVKDLVALAEKTARTDLQRRIDALLDEEEGMRKAMDPRLNLECAVVRLAYLAPLVPIDELLRKVETLEGRLAAPAGRGTVPASPREEPAPLNNDAAPVCREEPEKWNREEGKEAWDAFKTHVKRFSQPLWCRIEPGEFLGFEGSVFRIGFPGNYVFFDDLSADENRVRLEQLGRECLGKDVTIRAERLSNGPGGRNDVSPNGQARGKRNHEIRTEALNHPNVQKVIDVFEGAEICEVIPKNGS